MSNNSNLIEQVRANTAALQEIIDKAKTIPQLPHLLQSNLTGNELIAINHSFEGTRRIPLLRLGEVISAGLPSLNDGIIQISEPEIIPNLLDPSLFSLKIPNSPLVAEWRINGIEYTYLFTKVLPILPASAGDKFRTDIVVANKFNDFEMIQGVESSEAGVPPAIPEGTILITEVNVYGSNITATPPAESGYIKKLSKQYHPYNISNPLGSTLFLSENNTTFLIAPSLGAGENRLNGFVASPSDQPYDGMDIFIKATGVDIELVHQHSSPVIRFYFADSANVIVEKDEIAHLKYNKINNRVELVSISSGGTGIYAGASPTTRTVGGISSGTNISGKTYDELFEGILAEYINPSISSFAIVGQSSLVEVGTAISGNKNFSFGFSQSGNVANNTIKIIDVTDGNNVLATGRPKTSPQTVNIGSVAKTTATENVWRIEAESTKGATIARNMSIEWVYPLFATTSSITVGTKQPLVSMESANNVVINLVAESGSNKQFFDIPQVWLNSRPLIKIEIFDFNTNAWNSQNQLSTFTAVSNTHTINGNVINYKRYTNNGSSRGAIRMRLIF